MSKIHSLINVIFFLMGNPLNPMDWIQYTQNWFTKTERSSGYRPYLIFVLIYVVLAFLILMFFRDIPGAIGFALNSLYILMGVFVIHFFIKSLQDPDFCRSEKHIENKLRMELAENSGGNGPTLITPNSMPSISDRIQPILPPPNDPPPV
ncbi:MAG: hypothetical protein HY552_01515 [Elusimicrobia bacterium]|nr:hypothetical protein [Elusimicrobiota bacterium]